MKNVLMVVALLVTTLAAPLLAQDDMMMRWDGADDLDVNPLACPSAEMMEDDGEMMEMPEYDGGQPTDAPDLMGADITLVDIPKLIGIGYFAATTKGQQQAAEELGNVSVTTDAPPKPTSMTRSPSSRTTSLVVWMASSSPPMTRLPLRRC